eukprot:3817083-Karenia_brevis.AAC.1
MKVASGRQYGNPTADEIPLRQYVGLRVVGLGKDEPKAERLSEISAASDQQEDFLMTSSDPDGSVKINKGAKDFS